MRGRFPRRASIAALAVAILAASALAGVTAAAESNTYVVHNLVSNQPGVADHARREPRQRVGAAPLCRPRPGGWPTTAPTSSTLYRADGTDGPARRPASERADRCASRTPARSFVVSHGHASGPAVFIFATEDGKIRGWNPSVASATAVSVVAADRSKDGAIYKGLAIARRQRATGSTRPTSTTGASTSSTAASSRSTAAGRVRRPEHARRASPRSGSRTSAERSSSPTRSRTRPRTTTSPARASASSTCSTRAGRCSAASRSSGQLNSPWGLAMAPATSAASAATCSSATSATGRSTPTSCSERQASSSAAS